MNNFNELKNKPEYLNKIIDNLQLLREHNYTLSQIEKDIILQNLREAYVIMLSIKTDDMPEEKYLVGKKIEASIPSEEKLMEKEKFVRVEIPEIPVPEMGNDIFALVEEPKPEIIPESKPEIIFEPEPEIIPEAKPEIILEPEPEIVPEAKPEFIPKPEPEIVPEPKPEFIPKPEPEIIPELKPEIVPEPIPVYAPEISFAPELEVIATPKQEVAKEPEPVPELSFSQQQPAPEFEEDDDIFQFLKEEPVSYIPKETHQEEIHKMTNIPPQPQKRSLNDLLTEKRDDNSLITKFQNAKITDLTKSISINDKFLFIKELFKNRGEEFSTAIQTLNNCQNIDEAFEYMGTLKKHYFWDSTSPAYLTFCDLIRRKF